jgi:hypothetical protein
MTISSRSRKSWPRTLLTDLVSAAGRRHARMQIETVGDAAVPAWMGGDGTPHDREAKVG